MADGYYTFGISGCHLVAAVHCLSFVATGLLRHPTVYMSLRFLVLVIMHWQVRVPILTLWSW